jgi:NADH-quinone oxidoreductase subunit M
VAATGVILAAVYMLWAVQRAFTGEPDEKNAATRDIGFREICTVAPLLGLSLFLGFYPKPVLDRLEPSVAALVHQVDAHSNHKTPTVGTTATAEKCVIDSNGKIALGPCPKKPGK